MSNNSACPVLGRVHPGAISESPRFLALCTHNISVGSTIASKIHKATNAQDQRGNKENTKLAQQDKLEDEACNADCKAPRAGESSASNPMDENFVYESIDRNSGSHDTLGFCIFDQNHNAPVDCRVMAHISCRTEDIDYGINLRHSVALSEEQKVSDIAIFCMPDKKLTQSPNALCQTQQETSPGGSSARDLVHPITQARGLAGIAPLQDDLVLEKEIWKGMTPHASHYNVMGAASCSLSSHNLHECTTENPISSHPQAAICESVDANHGALGGAQDCHSAGGGHGAREYHNSCSSSSRDDYSYGFIVHKSSSTLDTNGTDPDANMLARTYMGGASNKLDHAHCGESDARLNRKNPACPVKKFFLHAAVPLQAVDPACCGYQDEAICGTVDSSHDLHRVNAGVKHNENSAPPKFRPDARPVGGATHTLHEDCVHQHSENTVPGNRDCPYESAIAGHSYKTMSNHVGFASGSQTEFISWKASESPESKISCCSNDEIKCLVHAVNHRRKTCGKGQGQCKRAGWPCSESLYKKKEQRGKQTKNKGCSMCRGNLNRRHNRIRIRHASGIGHGHGCGCGNCKFVNKWGNSGGVSVNHGGGHHGGNSTNSSTLGNVGGSHIRSYVDNRCVAVSGDTHGICGMAAGFPQCSGECNASQKTQGDQIASCAENRLQIGTGTGVVGQLPSKSRLARLDTDLRPAEVVVHQLPSDLDNTCTTGVYISLDDGCSSEADTRHAKSSTSCEHTLSNTTAPETFDEQASGCSTMVSSIGSGSCEDSSQNHESISEWTAACTKLVIDGYTHGEIERLDASGMALDSTVCRHASCCETSSSTWHTMQASFCEERRPKQTHTACASTQTESASDVAPRHAGDEVHHDLGTASFVQETCEEGDTPIEVPSTSTTCAKGKGKVPGPAPTGKGKGSGKAGHKPEQTSRVKPLGWRKMSCNADGTIWSGSSDADRFDLSRGELEELFAWGMSKLKKSQQHHGRVSITTGARSMTISIGLHTLRHLEFTEIRKAIIELDLTVLTADAAELLLIRDPKSGELSVLPNSVEIEAARNYVEKGSSIDDLNIASKFIVSVHDVPYLHDRLLFQRLRVRFDKLCDDFLEALQTLEQALRQVKDSKCLATLIRLVLKIGNMMNEGSSRGNAKGFYMESLRAVPTVKQTPKEGEEALGCSNLSLLDHISSVVVQQRSDLLDINKELSALPKGSRVELLDTENEIRKLETEIEVLAAYTTNSNHSEQIQDVFLELALPFAASGAVRIKELHSAVACVRDAYTDAAQYLGEDAQARQPHDLVGFVNEFVQELCKSARKHREKLEAQFRLARRKSMWAKTLHKQKCRRARGIRRKSLSKELHLANRKSKVTFAEPLDLTYQSPQRSIRRRKTIHAYRSAQGVESQESPNRTRSKSCFRRSRTIL